MKLRIRTREEEVWQYMFITVLVLKYPRNKAPTAMIWNVHASNLLEKPSRI